jgi:serine/threonine protein kinase
MLERQLELSDWLSKQSEPQPGSAITRPAAEQETFRGTITEHENEAPLPADDFQILRKLGSGGMGDVYLARQKSLQKDVAIKRLKDAARIAPEARERFFREAYSVARLRHPNIVGVHGIGKWDQGHFLLMDYVEGESLSERLKRGPLPIDDVLQLGVVICDALAHAHARGVIHRDLKPGNILVNNEGRPFVTDFGIAKWSSSNFDELTEPGQILGTPQYMSPEQFDPSLGPTDERTDVYGMGGLLFAMLTGRPPVEGKSAPEALRNLLTNDRPRPVRDLRPDVPESLDRLVQQCLSHTASERPATAVALKQALERCHLELNGQPTGARSTTVRDVSRSKRIAAFAAVGLSLYLLLAAWKSRTDSNGQPSNGPLLQSWRIDVFRDGLQSQKEELTSTSRPLQSGDQIRLTASFSRPTLASLYWVGADGSLSTLSSPNKPVEHLAVPEQSGSALPVTGDAGTEVALLVLHAQPWSESERIAFERAAAGRSPTLTTETAVVDGLALRSTAADDAGTSQLLSQLKEPGRNLGSPEPIAQSQFDREMKQRLQSLTSKNSEVHYLAVIHEARKSSDK